jgi:hypothetical protein
MALRTPVNSRITDAITQQSVQVLCPAPAMAMGAIYQSSAHSIGILYQNTVAAQRQATICAQAATNQGVIHLYSAGSMAGAAATAKTARSSTADDILKALLILKLLK